MKEVGSHEIADLAELLDGGNHFSRKLHRTVKKEAATPELNDGAAQGELNAGRHFRIAVNGPNSFAHLVKFLAHQDSQ